MIYLISTQTYPISSTYKQVDLSHFDTWIKLQREYELDIETNVVDLITERQIYVVQFGAKDKTAQYVLDVASFPEQATAYVKRVLSDKSQLKIIHNAIFEYTVIKQCWGIEIDNIYDTFLMLKVILNGRVVPDGIFKLSGAVKYFLRVEMDKEEQTSFTGVGLLSDSQIKYAAKDVMHLSDLRAVHVNTEYYRFFEPVIAQENKVVRAFGDIICNGFLFDKDAWRENMEWVKPEIKKAKDYMMQYMVDNYLEQMEDLGFIQKEDTIPIAWTSPTQRKAIFSNLYPDLAIFTKPALKKYELTIEEDGNPIYLYLMGEFEELNNYLLVNHKPLLEEQGQFIPKGNVNINLDSPKQRLEMFKLIEPSLTSTGEEALKNLKHPFFKIYHDYIGKTKLLSSYGENWFSFVSEDGRIRPQFIDQVLDTGRVSFKKPAMMTIPADEGYYLGDRYRKPFIATPGWKIVAGDYSSQELAVIAFLANETVWLDALKNGKDLHSVCAALVFKQQWVDAGGDYNGTKPKDEFPDAVKLRSFTKTISFGLAYGGGPGMLATRLNISMVEARKLIKDYFAAFPKLKEYFEGRAQFAMLNGFIYTAPPFYRRRYFPKWNADYVDPMEISSIERQGKNTSIQGTGADGSKEAMISIKKYIEDNNLNDKVRIIFMLHDAIVTEAKEEYAEEWATIQERLMVEAHNTNIPGSLIGADVKITDTWTK